MPTSTPSPTFIPQQEHRGLSQTIDALYIDTVGAKALLQERLCTGIGMLRDSYHPFYRNFVALFTMTCKHKEMDPYTNISERIMKWARPSRHLDETKCILGIDLFDEWQAALFKAGLLSVRR